MPEGGLSRMSLLAKEQGALLTEAMLEASLARSSCLARAACQYGAAGHREPAIIGNSLCKILIKKLLF